MTVLDYHRLRNEEARSLDVLAIEAAVRARDADLPERVRSLLPAPDEKLAGDLVDLQPSPLHTKLAALTRLYLGTGEEQRVFIRSVMDGKAARQVRAYSAFEAVHALR